MDEREAAAGRDGGLGGEPVGVAWLLLERMHDLRAGMERMEGRFDARLDALDRRVGQLDAKLDRQVERLDAKLDTLGDRLDAKIDSLGERLDAKIDTLGDRLDAKIDAGDVRLDAKVTGLSAQVASLQKWMVGLVVTVLLASGSILAAVLTRHP